MGDPKSIAAALAEARLDQRAATRATSGCGAAEGVARPGSGFSATGAHEAMRLRRRRSSAFLATASRPATTDGPLTTGSCRSLFACLLALLLRSIDAQSLSL